MITIETDVHIVAHRNGMGFARHDIAARAFGDLSEVVQVSLADLPQANVVDFRAGGLDRDHGSLRSVALAK